MTSQPRHRTLRSWVYESLSERIITGQLMPGTVLVETQLAAEMGVSRSPIREALRQLDQDGLVVNLPNSTTTVAPFEESDIDQIFEMRDLLESMLVGHAAIERTEAELAECAALLDTMPGFAAKEDIPHYAAGDALFHSLIWRMGKRPRILETIMPIANQGRRYLNLASKALRNEFDKTLLASHEEHLQVFDAIREQDELRAKIAIREHMLSSRARILRSFREEKEVAMANQVGS